MQSMSMVKKVLIICRYCLSWWKFKWLADISVSNKKAAVLGATAASIHSLCSDEMDCFLNSVVQNRTWPCQWAKTFFRGGTKRATPVIRKIVKRGVGWRICFWFSLIRIVNISAIAYLALVHIFRGSHDDSPLIVNRKDNILSTPWY